MRKKIENVLKVLIFASFFVPLVVIPSSFIFPFIVPKMVFFRSMVEIMLGLYILLLLINWQEYRPRLTPITVAVLAFYIFSFGLSTLFGTDIYHSFWDNHERMLGFFTVIHYVLYYLILPAGLKNTVWWKWAMRTFLFAGSIVMFIGMLQVANPDMLLNQGSSRIISTLGNPIYVGGYGLFLLFIAAMLFVKEKNIVWKIIYAPLAILAILGVFFSGTRGSMLALPCGFFTVALVYAIALRGYKKIRITIAVILALFLASIGVLYANRQTEFVKNIPAVGRAVNTSLHDITDSPRWIAWGISWQSFKARPFFGWGPNNFFYAFNYYYDPQLLLHGYGETWFDNAHNIVMNTLAVQGAPGIITYFGVFIVSGLALIFAYRQRKIDVHLLAIGVGFLATHFVSNITVFENITSLLYFMFWLAMMNAAILRKAGGEILPENNNQPTSAVPVITPDQKIGAPSIIIVSLFVLSMVCLFNIRPAKDNVRTLDAIHQMSQNPVTGITAMQSALQAKGPHIDDIRSDIARVAAQLVYGYSQQMDPDYASQLADTAYTELKKNLDLHPRDVRNHMVLSQLAQIRAYLHDDAGLMQEAIDYMETALDYSPDRQQLMYTLALYYAQVGRLDLAVDLLDQAIVECPEVTEGYWRLAYVYKLFGLNDKMVETIKMSRENGVVFSEADEATIEKYGLESTTTPVIFTEQTSEPVE